MNTAELSSVCKQVRRDIITMIANAGSGHPGGSLSMVELMTSVFYNHMRIDPKNPKNPDRDRFVLSKGHAAPCYYAVLAELGFISRDEFTNFRQLHSILQGHPDCKKVPGVDASTGSLGQGCSIAVGMALGAKQLKKDTKVYTILGDGECQEGQIWEAFMAANHYKLDNLTIIIDNNGLQIDGSNDEVMSLGDLPAKLRAFGFDFYEIEVMIWTPSRRRSVRRWFPVSPAASLRTPSRVRACPLWRIRPVGMARLPTRSSANRLCRNWRAEK